MAEERIVWNSHAESAATLIPVRLQAMAPAAYSGLPTTTAPGRKAAEPAAKEHFIPVRETFGKRGGSGGGGAIASNKALANLPAAQQGVAKEVYPPAAYADYPDRGLYAWASASRHESKQKPLFGYTNYEMKGNTYSVGLLQDWTIDSSLGVSVDFIDNEVKSLQTADFRKSDVSGELFNIHYAGTILRGTRWTRN